MIARRTQRTRAFSLIELVIVVVIIGIIAGIAVPRIGSASAGANAAARFGRGGNQIGSGIDRL